MTDTINPHARRQVKIRAKGCCEDCGRRVSLDMHHIRRYRHLHPSAEPCTSYCHKVGDIPIAGIEEPDDWAALCRECHYTRHRDRLGEYWWDEEEMRNEWAYLDY
jgi:dissimilatory sulfite reductase (desulfoviridin) alpha/beta subunit